MRFFLDNCLAIRNARALDALLQPEHSFTHLQAKFEPNTKDVDWLTQLGKEGGWIVISGDYRIGRSAHEKAAWHASGLTVFFLGKGWTNISPTQQHSKLALLMEDIIKLAQNAKTGTGFSISINNKIQQVFEP